MLVARTEWRSSASSASVTCSRIVALRRRGGRGGRARLSARGPGRRPAGEGGGEGWADRAAASGERSHCAELREEPHDVPAEGLVLDLARRIKHAIKNEDLPARISPPADAGGVKRQCRQRRPGRVSTVERTWSASF